MHTGIEQPGYGESQTLGRRAATMVNHRAVYGSIAVLAALLLIMIPRLGAAATESPKEVVQETTDQVLKVLANSSLSGDQKRHEIEKIVYAHFDFRTLSRLVLARNWRRLTPQQQQEFVEEFKKHLSMTYGKNVETYNNERAVVTGDREEPGGDWTVKTRIIRPTASDFDVDYRLRKEEGEWRVIDVIIEGVSLVANYRSQFQEIVSNQGPAKLIELLHEKNVKGEPLKS